MPVKNTAEIENTLYGEWDGKKWIPCEPEKDEIEKAIKEKNFETRSYQGYKDELYAEFAKGALNPKEYYARIKNYHTHRIAYFTSTELKEPILLSKNERTISDGLHRLKAAIHLGVEEVEVIILPDNGGARMKRMLIVLLACAVLSGCGFISNISYPDNFTANTSTPKEVIIKWVRDVFEKMRAENPSSQAQSLSDGLTLKEVLLADGLGEIVLDRVSPTELKGYIELKTKNNRIIRHRISVSIDSAGGKPLLNF